jgi:hypothetical protein
MKSFVENIDDTADANEDILILGINRFGLDCGTCIIFEALNNLENEQM